MIDPRRPFVLIRHGQTDANRDGLIAGRIEAQLTEAGRAAARALAGRPWPAAIALFISPQARARETALLAFPGRMPVILGGLRERDWGQFEGRPIHEMPAREATPEGGEPWPAMLARVGGAIRAAQDRAGAALPVLVAHSGVIRAARQLTGGSAHGPSPANTTPHLFRPTAAGWCEEILTEKDRIWTA
ncbi:histidine phosphatase family protein [Paenirhodobacter sp. CAU 1674]|nr:histidine phosphatase family protein [Paenirhodobacter sp. CAU 1674]